MLDKNLKFFFPIFIVIKGRVKTIIEQLDKSGLAADICKSKGSFKIKLRDIGRKYAFDSQHIGFHRENPNYYRFIKKIF